MSEVSASTPSEPSWLVLVYRVPSEPTRLRATVWRRLRSMGAVYLQNSVAAMPAGKTSEHALRKLRREILDMDGSALLLSADALVGSAAIMALFQKARDAEYEEILDKCNDFHTGLEKEYAEAHFTYGELEENEVELVKLRGWMDKVIARDTFRAPFREKTTAALQACSEALEAYAARVYEEDGDEA
ncbi:Chromate resistance protein ChrB [Leekyejoonella antrihumi]|uniref:ChrB domain-containing protein n=1 Tax=Leekyejoonella antrihumi TaxID=1660198 RepID=A0A563E754_9MICO|nr:Chromate resistance protein ChrB [Leekyejoonella antrihumi]TWP38327.1 ChrB domain-containing protein [Leekyejoonella antrihumi]